MTVTISRLNTASLDKLITARKATFDFDSEVGMNVVLPGAIDNMVGRYVRHPMADGYSAKLLRVRRVPGATYLSFGRAHLTRHVEALS